MYEINEDCRGGKKSLMEPCPRLSACVPVHREAGYESSSFCRIRIQLQNDKQLAAMDPTNERASCRVTHFATVPCWVPETLRG